MPRTDNPQSHSGSSNVRSVAQRLIRNAEIALLGISSAAGSVSMVDESTMVGPEAFLAAHVDPLFRTISTNTDESHVGRVRSDLAGKPAWQVLRAEGPVNYIKARWHTAIAPLTSREAEREAGNWAVLKCCESEDFAHSALSGFGDFPPPEGLCDDKMLGIRQRPLTDASCDALPLGRFDPFRVFVDLGAQTDAIPPLLCRDASVWTKEAKAAAKVAPCDVFRHQIDIRDIGLLKAHQDFGINVSQDRNTSA
jgi:hypothetical protein